MIRAEVGSLYASGSISVGVRVQRGDIVLYGEKNFGVLVVARPEQVVKGDGRQVISGDGFIGELCGLLEVVGCRKGLITSCEVNLGKIMADRAFRNTPELRSFLDKRQRFIEFTYYESVDLFRRCTLKTCYGGFVSLCHQGHAAERLHQQEVVIGTEKFNLTCICCECADGLCLVAIVYSDIAKLNGVITKFVEVCYFGFTC